MENRVVKKLNILLISSQDTFIKEIKFFNNGTIDSLSRYFKGKLVQVEQDFDSLRNSNSKRKYIYEDEQLIKVINFWEGNKLDIIKN